MNETIVILGTFDSKGEEHRFLKDAIERRGLGTLTIHAGTKGPSLFAPDFDLYQELLADERAVKGRDEAIAAVIDKAKALVLRLQQENRLSGIVSAGGGTGTYLATSVMRILPVGVPKVMVSTVASRDMSRTVGTRDITMMHSVADLLGINSLSGMILDKAAAAICGMARSRWAPPERRKRIGLTMFGFITDGAEAVKRELENLHYEVIAFHANGTGGMAMEELAAEGLFDGLLDLATHELADELLGGYCRGIGPQRLLPSKGKAIPRLVVPGGLDCAVLEFTRASVPDRVSDRKIFFYDFRSGIRLNDGETRTIAAQLAGKLNRSGSLASVLIPSGGWSEADRKGGPLYDPAMSALFVRVLRDALDPAIEVVEVDLHINDAAFARIAAAKMDRMIRERWGSLPSAR
jgi:uncharacterized protein (UPF0261 family)